MSESTVKTPPKKSPDRAQRNTKNKKKPPDENLIVDDNHLDSMRGFKKVRPCPVIAGVNKKGGVGKTMLSCAIGTIAAHAGLKVLIIETCEQMNAVNLLANDRSVKNSIHFSLVDLVKNPSTDLMKLIITTKVKNLMILPASIGMSEFFSRTYSSYESGFVAMKQAIDRLRSVFDLIIIDSPPNDNQLPVTALANCSHYFFINDGDNNSFDGIRQLQNSIIKICKTNNPGIECLGILINDKLNNPAVCQALIGTGGEPPFNYINYMIPHSKKPISYAFSIANSYWLGNAFRNNVMKTPIEKQLYDFTHFLMGKMGLIDLEANHPLKDMIND